MGGSWDKWWLKTPLPGVVWCNCPHMVGFDGLKVEDLTRADFEGRKRIHALVDFVRAKMPGFKNAFVVDVAPQLGIRPTRLLEGEYVVTKDDVIDRVHFADRVARGRDYYTPYRSLLPQQVEQLLVAGRHYSATAGAQKMSREIPPCMAMGEAAGVAAALALDAGTTVRKVDAKAICSARCARKAPTPATGRRRMPVSFAEAARVSVDPNGNLPLAGIRVIDFTQVMMGPCATQMLADYGADVIKIERPGTGDLSRTAFPNDPAGLLKPMFCCLNRNKRSVVLDPRDKKGRAAVAALLKKADVVVNNFRAGVMERMGFGYEELSKINPRIIYAVGTGFGLTAAVCAQGRAGRAGAGDERRDGAPLRSRRCRCRCSPRRLADYSAGMHLVQGMLLALLAAREDRRGDRWCPCRC